ncbi:hypothetical protein [Taylorella equigenitalis]|uniref:Exported protein n=1 Tax=Taylorella equigenitalis ATCC 35865 TaxID=743973 RepID=A0ABM5N8T2_9BURK|nr:hypothetical protein [Taylorella equigenitalis]AFN35207.1 putative exported protein [Taylorella equigenitalis ATCC 35865]ASY38650.1 hypothetical protein CA604_00515 [Taylorella equigenitalis]WDU54963.1 hypothetical protein KPZ19_00645 [Taylorella equigenitalis]VEG30238.1 Uncharacterised protein [Taylorella equigenitalis ATCC 35865]
MNKFKLLLTLIGLITTLCSQSFATDTKHVVDMDYINKALDARESISISENERFFLEGKQKKTDYRENLIYQPSPQGKIFCASVLMYPTAESAYECAFNYFIFYLSNTYNKNPNLKDIDIVWINTNLELARILMDKYNFHYAEFYSKYDNKIFWEKKVSHLQTCLDNYTRNFIKANVDASCIIPTKSPFLNETRKLPDDVIKHIFGR